MHKPLYSQKFELDLDLFWENKIICCSHKIKGLRKEYVVKYVPLLRNTPYWGSLSPIGELNAKVMPQIHIPAAHNKPIIRRRFSSVPRTYRFSAQPVDPMQPLSGSVAIHSTTWIVPRAPVTQPLMASQEVTAGFWDTFLSVYVQPDTDVVVTIESGGTPATKWIMLAALLVGLLALAFVLFMLAQ